MSDEASISVALTQAEAKALLDFLRHSDVHDDVFRRAPEKLRVALRDAAEPGWPSSSRATSSGRSPATVKVC